MVPFLPPRQVKQPESLPGFGGSIVKRFSRILAAVDFSKPARGAFEYALALSQRHGAEERFALTATAPSESCPHVGSP